MIQKEYKKPWKVQDWGLHWFSKLNEKIRLKYNGFNIKKSAYKETVVLKYKDGGLTKKTKFYVYDKKDPKYPKNYGKKKPLLLVIPPIYDISPFDYWQAYDFAERGYKVAILDLGGMSYVSPLQPTSSINKSTLKTIGDAILQLNKDLGYTFCMIEHNMEFISKLCDPVIVMAEGTVLAQGSASEIKSNNAVIEAYLGTGQKNRR